MWNFLDKHIEAAVISLLLVCATLIILSLIYNINRVNFTEVGDKTCIVVSFSNTSNQKDKNGLYCREEKE
jgi:hypothetical protein